MKRNGYNEYNDYTSYYCEGSKENLYKKIDSVINQNNNTTTLITVEIHQIKNLNDKRQ